MLSFFLIPRSYQHEIVIVSFDEQIDDVAVYNGATIKNLTLNFGAINPIGAVVIILGKGRRDFVTIKWGSFLGLGRRLIAGVAFLLSALNRYILFWWNLFFGNDALFQLNLLILFWDRIGLAIGVSAMIKRMVLILAEYNGDVWGRFRIVLFSLFHNAYSWAIFYQLIPLIM